MRVLASILKGLLLPTSASQQPTTPLSTHHLFHKLWSNAVGKKGYDKTEWLRLEREFFSSKPQSAAPERYTESYPPSNSFAHATTAFEKELVALINKHGQEYGSGTADFILARYLRRCLEAFNEATNSKQRGSADH